MAHKRGGHRPPQLQHADPKSLSLATQPRLDVLSLPPEITTKILRELLQHPEPLDGFRSTNHAKCTQHISERHRNCWPDGHSPNFSLHPQILRTCHRLHDEGIAVLYHENSIRLHIFHDFIPYFATLSERSDSAYELDLRVVDKFPRVEIRIHVLQPIDIDANEEAMMTLLLAVGEMCDALETEVQTIGKQLKIDVAVTNKCDQITTPYQGKPVNNKGKRPRTTDVLPYLSTFRTLRCQGARVFLGGQDFDSTPAWVDIMTSRKDIPHLYQMYKAVEVFFDDYGHEIPAESRRTLVEAMVEWNMKKLIRARKELLSTFKREFDADFQALYYDEES